MLKIIYGKQQAIIDPAHIETITIETSIFSLYTIATLHLIDFGGMLQNAVRLGDDVDIHIGEAANKQIYRMHVESVEKKSSGASSNLDIIILNLVSAWAHQQVATTAAYRGSVSSIAKQLLNMDPFFSKRNPPIVEDSDDRAAIRYRIHQPIGEFLKSIEKFATKNLSPMFLFMNHKEQIVLKSFEAMITSRVAHTFRMEVSSEEAATMGSPTEFSIPMVTMKLDINGEEASSERSYWFSTKNIQYTDQVMKQMIFPSSEASHTLVSKPSPPTDLVVHNWATAPFDSISLSLRDALLKDFTLFKGTAVTTSLRNTGLDVGNVVNVKMDTIKDRLHDGTYLIIGIQYNYSLIPELCRVDLLHIN